MGTSFRLNALVAERGQEPRQRAMCSLHRHKAEGGGELMGPGPLPPAGHPDTLSSDPTGCCKKAEALAGRESF